MQLLWSSATAHLISFCSVQLRTLGRLLFGNSLSLYDLWFVLFGVAWLLKLHGLALCHLRNKLGDNNCLMTTLVGDHVSTTCIIGKIFLYTRPCRNATEC